MFLNLFTSIQSRKLHAETQLATKRANTEEGAVAVEYALLVVLIALVMAVGAAVLGRGIDTEFDNVAATLAA